MRISGREEYWGSSDGSSDPQLDPRRENSSGNPQYEPDVRVVKTIKGHQYVYLQQTYRQGEHVRTLNRYVGRAQEKSAAPRRTACGFPVAGSVARRRTARRSRTGSGVRRISRPAARSSTAWPSWNRLSAGFGPPKRGTSPGHLTWVSGSPRRARPLICTKERDHATFSSPSLLRIIYYRRYCNTAARRVH